MVDTKKEQERQELFAKIWKIADDLRGAVDGWDFKAYVIGTMFYRFLSENIAAFVNENERAAGDDSFDYARFSDDDVTRELIDYVVETKGFFIKPSELFCNVLAKAEGQILLTNDGKQEDLNEIMSRVLRNIEESARGTASESDYKGLFSDYSVNSSKLGVTVDERNKRLTRVLQGVAAMNLKSADNTIDAFGDAYEYLLAMYASTAGKSGGEFFTPQEVSELLAKLATHGQKSVNKVYDPACGSGSLLLRVLRELDGKFGAGIFGQEINLTTYNMCRINMILHGVDYTKFDIALGDTLLHPAHWDDEPFDVIVSNPPYSTKWAGDSDVTLVNDERFAPAGVLAPQSKADLAFVMHSLSWLSQTGAAAIVCFPGVMYRGGAEQKIRRHIVEQNAVDCVIQLPSNLFFGTSIATCILVLRKNKRDNAILFVDASAECVKVTNNNKLTPENIAKIADAVAARENVDYFSRLVPYEEVKENDFNLSVSTYVEQRDTREKIDIVKLNAEIREIVAREQVLRDEIDKIIAEIEGDAVDA